MQTLSYGYKKPEPSDTGDVFYPAMAANMDTVNNHTHNGSDAAPIAGNQVSLASGSWVAVGARPGVYRQTMIIAPLFDTGSSTFWFIDSSGNSVNLEYSVASASSIIVYTNDSSETYTAYYK